jgi:cysteinyl-tRNA synthetase
MHMLSYAVQAEPKATDFIPAMVATITKIIDNGHAYALPDGGVYFDVASLPGYGRLSGRSQVWQRWQQTGCMFHKQHCRRLDLSRAKAQHNTSRMADCTAT